MALQHERFQLDPERSNQTFQSWQLSRGSEGCEQSRKLYAELCVAGEGSCDYLHTRASLLQNRLRTEGSVLYPFLQTKWGIQLERYEPFLLDHGTGSETLTLVSCHACFHLEVHS